MNQKLKVRIQRVYEPATEQDGLRVLVDRLWPRGLRKDEVRYDVWAKQLAPSPDLRKWFDHDPQKYEEFSRRYRLELSGMLEELQDLTDRADTITLLYAARDPVCNHARVLQAFIEEM